ncbi:hypothetical protein [Granulicatella seriolae]|uniref:Uncharacterized protein n=1 Tax=Granulicatella seriolae TaxID=2967226 RepID=A0ABT1WP16_9LACT|nr:hypothetical protein [Granulicatella seriolae]
MKCTNKECDYIFIKEEVNYIACPNCGKAVKENLPKDTNKRVELYQIIKSFQTCLRFEKNKYYIIFRSAFILIFLSMITYPLHDGMHYNSLIMNSMRLNSNSNILLLLLVFFMPFDRYKPFKKFKKEKAWLFKSVWFKILRLTLIPNYSYHKMSGLFKDKSIKSTPWFITKYKKRPSFRVGRLKFSKISIVFSF